MHRVKVYKKAPASCRGTIHRKNKTKTETLSSSRQSRVYHPQPAAVYHQNGVLYITNTTCYIDARRLSIPSLRSLHQAAGKYTLTRDYILAKGEMISTTLRAVMIYQVCDLDKKIPVPKNEDFL